MKPGEKLPSPLDDHLVRDFFFVGLVVEAHLFFSERVGKEITGRIPVVSRFIRKKGTPRGVPSLI